jgi:hypothetical protein
MTGRATSRRPDDDHISYLLRQRFQHPIEQRLALQLLSKLVRSETPRRATGQNYAVTRRNEE